MNFAGIIAEYNPFHNGHAAQLTMLRERGAKTIAVCMSSGAVQRGELPLLPEPVRVKAALEGGADLVLALPAPYACASAELFASAGVHILAALGCDTLAFGAETPQTDTLMQAAVLLQSADFTIQLRNFLDDGLPMAAARSAAANLIMPGVGDILKSPNNILAVEYCKAILTEGIPMEPLPLPRLGAEHGGTETGMVDGTGYASASRLRETLLSGDITKIERVLEPFVPQSAAQSYRQSVARGELLNKDKFSTAVLALLRCKTAEQLSQIRGIGEGLENRLAAAVRSAATTNELYAALATKRYTNARLRRLVLDAALEIRPMIESNQILLPPYLHILGARKAALSLLQNASLPTGTSLAELERADDACARVAALHTKVVDFSSLCRQKTMPMGLAYTTKPVLLFN